MSLVLEYIEAAVELARAERFAVLARLIDRRLRDSTEPLLVTFGGGERSIVSPAVEIDEPDRNALLYEIFHLLEDHRENAAIETMRRVSVELLMQGLNRGEAEEYVQLAALLVGHTLVVENTDLSVRLQQQLYGYLEGRLNKPLPQLIELEGKELAMATLAFDVWLAVTPIRPPWPPHLAGNVQALFDTAYRLLDRGDLVLESRFELLSFAFQALLKVRPRIAGQSLWRICRLLAADASLQLRRRWLEECRHLALELNAVPDWRQSFVEGIRLSPWFEIGENPPVQTVLTQTLTSLEMEEEIEATRIIDDPYEVAGSVTPLLFDDLGKLGHVLYEGSGAALARAMRSVIRTDPLFCSG